ncbi:alpha-hydroxy acid oxidase [Azoarcus olearius]|uniref:Conserved hypothetical L-lactate dehydrogenase (Cytochrome) n=1 Tax=Azoarcus sp. (strain BH72) TaxID=418699 RepID=A1K8D2_AZOSB|nr:alpha-hydroxy acid oxidase [Azoarcus olearius]CAL95087.1 conserved hypothetical L-lactate dehydrogenase (cytochrome) [Azoarcus olearius]
MDIDDLRRQARRFLPRFVFDFLEGGAGDETCLQENLAALRNIRLWPSVLRDTSGIDTSIEVFGERWRLPFAVAPTGFNGLFRPDGDILIARAAARAGVPFSLSTASNTRLEEVARQADGLRWLQLYVMGDRSIAEQIMRRGWDAGYRVLVLTVDVPVNGYRKRDIRNGFRLPFRPGLMTALDLARHPRWILQFAGRRFPNFANLSEHPDTAASAQVQAALLNRTMDRTLAWESLSWVRAHWKGPVVVKGVLHPDDAARAVAEGADGIVVSNHGGRQLKSAPATIEALPLVVERVDGAVPVFVDGGFRSGEDVAKALGRGAKAVFLGRPVLYGLAAAGEAGVERVFDWLREDLERTMILMGRRRIDELATGWRP